MEVIAKSPKKDAILADYWKLAVFANEKRHRQELHWTSTNARNFYLKCQISDHYCIGVHNTE